MKPTLALVALLAATPCFSCKALAAREKGPPLPLHTIEGTSGHFSVPSAYLLNPGPEGSTFGYPVVGAFNVHLGHGKQLESLTMTETLWNRLELGYGLTVLNVGDVYHQINYATGLLPSGSYIRMHNFNAKVQAIREGGFDQAWMPAVTVGLMHKINDSWEDLDDDLAPAGGLDGLLGIDDDTGTDFTLFATKMLTMLPRPLLVTLGARNTESAHLGLLGFTGERTTNVELAACYLLTDEVFFAGEYRQKPDEYTPIPGLVDPEDDWFVLAAGWVLSAHATLAIGYGHFGDMLNYPANKSLGFAFKYEF